MGSYAREKPECVGAPRATCDYPKSLPMIPHNTLRMLTRTSYGGEFIWDCLNLSASSIRCPKEEYKKAHKYPALNDSTILCSCPIYPHALPTIASWVLQRQSACFRRDVRSRYGHNARSHEFVRVCCAVVYRLDRCG